jgi:hypothetical protein
MKNPFGSYKTIKILIWLMKIKYRLYNGAFELD